MSHTTVAPIIASILTAGAQHLTRSEWEPESPVLDVFAHSDRFGRSFVCHVDGDTIPTAEAWRALSAALLRNGFDTLETVYSAPGMESWSELDALV